MADALITTDDLELAFNGSTEMLRRLCGDDGAGSYRTDRADYGIAVASEEMYGILLSGFDSNERVQALAAGDVAVRHAGAMIWRDVLAQGKDEFRLPDGGNVFSPDARKARDMLREKARGAKRSSAEETAAVGQSGLLRPRSAQRTTSGTFTDSCGKPVGF
jgi:hypothetical protein